MSDTAPTGRVVAAPVANASQPLVITDDVLQEALAKARDKGRREERTAQVKARDAALDAQSAAHAAELARLGEKTLDRERAAHAHGFHKAVWMSGFPGLVVGGLLVWAMMIASQQANFDAATQSAREGFVTGAVRSVVEGPAQPCIPGQRTLDDGTPCPSIRGAGE